MLKVHSFIAKATMPLFIFIVYIFGVTFEGLVEKSEDDLHFEYFTNHVNRVVKNGCSLSTKTKIILPQS